jgi:hypothetical protein
MSLLRLLTAGKSLIGLQRAESRYQLPGAKMLPRFGSKKNPFRATVFPEKVGVGPAEPEAASAGSQVSGGTGADRVGVERGGAQSSGGADIDSAEQQRNTSGVVERETSTTKEQIKPLDCPARSTSPVRAFLLWTRAKKAKSFGRSAGRAMVQAELSLEGVKVVRNDLSESDLEIVQARPDPVSKSAEEVGAGANPSSVPSRPSWVAPAGRLFGIGKM